MVDSYLHPKVVSFINYFYDYIRKEDPEVIMYMSISPYNEEVDIRIYRKDVYYRTRKKSYSIKSIIYGELKTEIEAKTLLKELQERCENIGKI